MDHLESELRSIVEDMRFHIKDLEANYERSGVLKPYLKRLEKMISIIDSSDTKDKTNETN